MRKAMVLGVFALAGTVASPAFADEFSGFRLGLNLSQDKMESDMYLGAVDETSPINTNRFGYGLMGGWGLNKWFAVEATLYGGSEYNADLFPLDVVDPEYLRSRTDLKGLEASAVGSLWIGKKFSLFGRVGLNAWKAETTIAAGFYDDPDFRAVVAQDDTGFDPVFGVGVQTVLDGALVRLEYKMGEMGNITLNDYGDPATAADDVNVFHQNNTDLSSLTLSIVWTL
jgi:hypothetical protein